MQDYHLIWEKCRAYIRQQIGEQNFTTWFAPIKAVSLKDNVLTIQVPNQFFYEWIEEHYVVLLRNVIKAEIGPAARLEYSVVVEKHQNAAKSYALAGDTATHTLHEEPTSQEQQKKAERLQSPFRSINQLNPRYRFDNYIEGPCNRMACAAGASIAEQPGKTIFNPLTIFGPTGYGKTHLVQAIGNRINERYSDKTVVYVTANDFMNQYVEATRDNMMQEFMNYYYKVDVLIMDDIHTFGVGDKQKTQDNFFNIFNYLHQNNKQIILTCDRPLNEVTGINERLISRFKWGMTAELDRPDFETKLAIILSKLNNEGLNLDREVAEYIALSVDTHVRDLEGVLVTLIAQSSLLNKEINLELAKEIISRVVQTIDTEVGIDYIQKIVGETFRVSVEEMKDKTRKKEIVTARHVAMYLAKRYTNMTLQSIGYYFGKRDHTTVMHAMRCVSDQMDVDKKFRAQVIDLEKRIKPRSL